MNLNGTCGCGSAFAVYHGDAINKTTAVLRFSEWLVRHARCDAELGVNGRASLADARYPPHTEGGDG